MSGSRDASMDLLRLVRESALDPGYAEAAAHRVAGWRRSGGRGVGLLIGTTVLGLLLGGVTASLAGARPQAQAEHDRLVAQVRAAESGVESLRRELRSVRSDVDALQAEALGGGSGAASTRSRLARAEEAAGAVALRGPGLVLTIDDAPDTGAAAEDGRVLDVDLRRAVNGLWEAGAEGVAVNGHRLTARSAIRGAGSAITVDYRSLTRPYRIEAIGDPRTLPAAFAATGGSSWLTSLQQNVGVSVEATTVAELTLPPAADAAVHHAHARR